MLVPALTTLVTYFGQTVPARLAITDGTGVPVPPDRDARLAEAAAQLAAFGFDEVATVAPSDPGAPLTTFGRALVDDAEATGAMVVDMRRGDIEAGYVELVTEWEDGTAVSTLNHEQPQIFEPLPRLRWTRLPGASVAEVVGAHRAACAEVPGRRLDPRRAHPVDIAQAHNEEMLAHQAACGILRRRGEDYGFTFRGARQSTFRVWNASRAAA